jgi:hypothetical protein
VSGREEPVVLDLKNLQTSLGLFFTGLVNFEIYSRFFDRIRLLM